jgi:hypothetical protein
MVNVGESDIGLLALASENVILTGVQFCKQNNWAFLSQARLSPSPSHIQAHPRNE